MLTQAICRTTPRVRSLQAKATAHNTLYPAGASSLRARHRQQTRAYRFGFWSSHRDPELHREYRRRHRAIKKKYVDTMSEGMDLHKFPISVNCTPGSSIKQMYSAYWNSIPPRDPSQQVEQDESTNQAKQTSERPGAPDAHTHVSSNDGLWSNYDSWRSQVDRVVNRWSKEATERSINHINNSLASRTSTNPTAEPGAQENIKANEYTPEEDYLIDPITNRRVPKQTSGSHETEQGPPTQTSDLFRAWSSGFDSPEIGEQRKPVYSDGGPAAAELNKYEQVDLDEWTPEGHASDPRVVRARRSSTEPGVWREEYSLNHLPPEESPEERYEDLQQYKHLEYDEINDNHNELHKSEPYMHHSDVAKEDTLRQKELDQYGPYRYREDIEAEEPATRYDDLEKYRSYNYEEMEQPDNTAPQYDDLDKYRPTEFKDNVEDGQPFEQYGDLERYKSLRYQDLDGNTALERDIIAESLNEYDAKEHEAGSTYTAEPQDVTSSDEIADTYKHNDGVTASESEPDPASLSMPWGNSWDDPKEETRKELDHLMDSNNELSDTVDQEASASVQEARMRAEDDFLNPKAHEFTLRALQAVRDERSELREAISSTADQEASARVQEDRMRAEDDYILPEDQVVASDPVRAYPDEISGSWDATSFPQHKVVVDPSGSAYEQEVQAEVQEAEKTYSDELADSSNLSKIEPALDRQESYSKLEPALDRWEAQPMNSTLSSGPEETRPDTYSNKPQGLQTSFAEEYGEQTAPVYAKTYGEPGRKDLEPAAVETAAVPDPFISSESSYDRDPEIDGFPRASTLEPATRSESFQGDGPTIYKILAYDPTMQTINIAETTSVVPDQATPLTPTEVLLRLSNPTKFFPHFAPLQAEGFEIVSGGGDVLVFRKVRPGQASTKDQDKDTAVNPIDMMGKPSGLLNAAEFASPTGFVNYNMPQVEGETQAPSPASRFRSNIDVRREEPVFSGPKETTSEEAPKKEKRGAVRRMFLAGTWVAGLSYAIGVVSEYFVTGGADGLGPTGF